MITRRALLLTGGASLAVLGGAGTYVLSKDIDPARAPWEAASRGFGDIRLDAAAYAILAPNPHNRQPWAIELKGEDRLVLTCDLDRLLPETDPPNRQITIGLGAFLELLRQAASEKGYEARITPFPEGEPYPLLDERPIAEVVFTRAKVRRDPLFGEALARRTLRDNFSSKPVSPEVLEKLRALAFDGAPDWAGAAPGRFAWSVEEERVEALKALCREGWLAETSAPAPHAESTKLTRIGASEVNANPDGISLTGPMMEAMQLTGLLSREKMDEKGSLAHQGTLNFYNGLIDSAAAFGWLTSPANTRADQLQAGADWLRLNLAATRLGLGFHPLSQVLQEFPEMAPHYERCHAMLGISAPARVQGLFRFGYAAFPEPAPRWPLQSRLIAL
ncbi:twin-arginine translocation pathway signal [Tepidicaulis marinus]|jgi:nitroreductase|uniref:Twin-arginine translocation pathway signal n=1 Tax=Tepidicaulis marinus TaxID=1333998 RepID=A0A081B869_9HYPH|nr:nitroreductase family protein [Tepidicaulis marinus]GAK44237.1 twin-arginine translocation pathway signal [Tepidicaulis marinus]